MALSPPGYIFKNFPRQSERKAGGRGIIFERNLNATLTDAGENRSFEFSEWNLSAHNRAVRIIAVYCPPYSEAHPVTANMFFDEFANYLENVVICPEILVIHG